MDDRQYNYLDRGQYYLLGGLSYQLGHPCYPKLFERDCDLTPNYVPTLIRELSTFFILQSGRRSVAEPGGLQHADEPSGY